MEKLTWVLWQERELLETLLYRLEVEELVMSTGRTRWLGNAARDVDEAAAAVREFEVLRAVAASAAAEAAGLESNAGLGELIAVAAEPWRGILTEHRDNFLSLTDEIARVAQTNRALIVSGLRATQDTLLGVDRSAATYTAAGAVDHGETRSAVLDRSL
ncbi:flagellar export chaperone FlgN [Nocardioides sp. YIM 152315]|uniref:flagellar export chaperone FlgN n=1 Tax=Nocardioides sp. YIM 152315 TaxID=3031760 RepID=UPI0023DBF611|nr:flagellar export chaperone FlgN [Nocardioides sp. YIM 152315]MDF1605953.1 flagellar export chaperone FlgN [Nocardioides sp. YIM 152315]